MDFWRAAEILNKRKWLIIFCVLMTTVLAWGATRILGAKWVATVTFESPQTSSLAGATGGAPEQILRGEDKKQAAKEQAEIYASLVRSRGVLESALAKADETQLPPDIMKDLDVVSINSRLYQLQVTHSTPARAMNLANAIADKFVEKDQELRTEQAHKVVALLADQLHQADAKLSHARERYENFRGQHDIPSSLANSMDPAIARLKIAREQSDAAATQLSEAQARLSQKEQDLRGLPATVARDVAPAPVNPMISQLKAELISLDTEVADLRVRFTDTSPQLRQKLRSRKLVQNQLSELQTPVVIAPIPNPVAVAARQDVAALHQQIKGYQAQVNELEKIRKSSEAEINRYKGVDSPLSMLANDISEQTESRSNLLARLNAARMAQDVAERAAPITLVDRVTMGFNPPVDASASRTLKIILMSSVGALLAMCCIVIALDSVDRRIGSVRQAERVLPARILAAIPQPAGAVTYGTLARATELEPQSLHAESYRFLGLHLLNTQHPPVRSLLVLSAKAEQGSTTTITNLGITLAQAGKRVVIVDANMRTAELHQALELPNDFGFMDLLQTPDTESLHRALQPTSVPNLFAITCGTAPSNPWELFRSDNLQTVSGQLRDFADFVLYDTPSAVIFTDALNLAPVADGAYLCVRAQQQLTGAEQRLVDLLKEAQVPVLGCVLTDVPENVFESYPDYKHYYGSLQTGYTDAGRGDRANGALPVLPPMIDAPGNRHRKVDRDKNKV